MNPKFRNGLALGALCALPLMAASNMGCGTTKKAADG